MKKIVFILFIVITVPSLRIFAQTAGTLDSTFGVNGKVITDFSLNTYDEMEDILIQPDGKIIAIGYFIEYAPTTNSSDVLMVRYEMNGFIDSSFGINGKAVYSLSQGGQSSDYIFDAALQNDGKILCTGTISYDSSSFQIVLARFLSNGVIDSVFGSNGFATLNPFPTTDDYGSSVVVQPDGKILVGATTAATVNTGLVARYNSNGIIDSTFGSNGIIFLNQQVGDIALLSTGKILAAGIYNTTMPSLFHFGVTRIDSTGIVDSTFGTYGLSYFDHTGIVGPTFGASTLQKINIQSDNKIVLGGSIRDKTPTVVDIKSAAGRMHPDGTMDSTFGSLGKIVIDFPGNVERIHDMEIQSDGKIFLCGATRQGPSIANSDFAIARVNSNGTLDNTFNGTGMLQIEFTTGWDYGYASALQSDGKLIVGGPSSISSSYYDFSMVRLLNNLNVGIIDLHENAASINIFPNPSTNQITIEFELSETKNVSIEIKNVLGQTIKTISNNTFTKGNNKIEIDVSEFSNGIYSIQLNNGDKMSNRKFIKQ